MLFAGSEFGLTGYNGEASRTPMPWNRPGDIDEEVLSSYRALFGLRKSQNALRHGGLRWIHAATDSLAFIRETESESIVVSAARNGTAHIPALPNLTPLFEAPGLSIWKIG